jgi:membrane protease subunit (stomatin/prohibitin family)
MGIMDFVKGGVKELAIARPDEFKDHIVYKHPDKTIPMKAQLTVEADELCLFFRDGVLVGQFAAGRHTLDSSNIPFLGQLVDKFTGGDVFIAEVYFVTTRETTGTKFGGKIGKIRDPQSGLAVELMVNGTFSTKVIDPARLVIGLVGLQRTGGNEFLAWFREQVLKTIRDDIAELMVKKKWPMLDVTSGAYTEEIETEVLAGVRQHVEAYGLEVIRMGNFNIGINEGDEQRLNKFYESAAYVNMAGGLHGYQQFAQANMMMNAGEGMKAGGGNGGAGGALTGAGLGIGLGMAGQMMGQMNQQGNQQGQGQGQNQGQPNTPASGMAGAVHNTASCPKCSAKIAPGKFCSECGATLAAPGPKLCPGCSQPVTGKFCPECGTAVPA